MLDTYMNALDLTLLSICRTKGQELPALPGLLAQNPPQKPARGRDQDRLLVYLTLTGNVGYSSSDYNEIVGQVAETFYNTPGSLTFALKTAVSSLNASLIENNMKSTGKGLYSNASLVLCTLRGNSMYVVQAGPTHVYHLSSETRHLNDPELAGKGLGLSQTARMYFSQVTISSGDRLLLCATLPPNWDKSLTESRGSASLETTRRRLLAITDANVSAVILLATDGNGAMNILKSVQDETPEPARAGLPSQDLSPAAPPVFTPDLSGDTPKINLPQSKADFDPGQPFTSVKADPAEPLISPVRVEVSRVDSPPANSQPAAEVPASAPVGRPFSKADLLPSAEAQESFNEKVRDGARYLARAIQSGRAATLKAAAWMEKSIPNLLPDNYEEQPLSSLSHNIAIFLAIAIPVLLFVVARIVYFQLGYEAQHTLYYNRAQDAAKQAISESSPSAARVEWQATLDWLDKADQFQTTADPGSQKFRLEAQTALDGIDKVFRVDFTPAFDSPPGKSVHVARISATDTEIYFMDAVTGFVSRAVYNGRNYDIDKSFRCQPGIYNDKVEVGQLVDIVAVPKSGTSNNSTLLGIDISGNLLFCVPGELPHAAALQMPGTGWKGVTAFAYNENTLYVLDAPARGVWFYVQDAKQLAFTGEPKIFFGEQIPVMLEQATGMAVNGNDLYLLHKDGHLATCSFSPDATSTATRCNDPAVYVDTRPGYQGGTNLSDGIFSQIAFTSAPDPAIALLEPFTQSIFRFSPRALELQNQVKANDFKGNPLPKGAPITAMAFSPNKILFVYVDGQMFFSVNAP